MDKLSFEENLIQFDWFFLLRHGCPKVRNSCSLRTNGASKGGAPKAPKVKTQLSVQYERPQSSVHDARSRLQKLFYQVPRLQRVIA